MGIQMQLGYVGINYKNTALSVRDKITFTDSGIADFMQQAEEAGVNQCMCLSTCNRCEVFYLYEDETFVQCRPIYSMIILNLQILN
ncbi:MAG: hypothetical protein ACLR7D_07155 [Lachnospira eligens]